MLNFQILPGKVDTTLRSLYNHGKLNTLPLKKEFSSSGRSKGTGTPTERQGQRLEALRERQSPKVARKDAEEIEQSKVDRHG
jgi:hypothetical protein